VQNEGMDLATLQVISNFLVAIFTAFLAIFTFFLWWVSEKQAKIAEEQAKIVKEQTEIAKKQAEIADRQTQIQQSLAKLETEPLVFLEFSKEGLTESDLSNCFYLTIVNMGRYGCLVLYVRAMPPDWDPMKPRGGTSDEDIIARNIPVLAGERKQIRKVCFTQEREFVFEVSYHYGGKPEEIRCDFFKVALSVTKKMAPFSPTYIEIKNVEIVYRSSHQP